MDGGSEIVGSVDYSPGEISSANDPNKPILVSSQLLERCLDLGNIFGVEAERIGEVTRRAKDTGISTAG